MISAITFGNLSAKPAVRMVQTKSLPVNNGDSFVRFGHGPQEDSEAWDPDDPRLNEALYNGEGFCEGLYEDQESSEPIDPAAAQDSLSDDALSEALSAMFLKTLLVLTSETEDFRLQYYAALDEGDCGKAREAMSKREESNAKLTELLQDTSDPEMEDFVRRNIETTQAAVAEEEARQVEEEMNWDNFLLGTGLLDADMIKDLPGNTSHAVEEQLRRIDDQISRLSFQLDQAVMEHRDEEALDLYSQYRTTLAEARALKDQDTNP